MFAVRALPLAAAALLAASLPPPAAAQAPPATGVIRPGVAWTDTAGARVYAGGADVVWEPSSSRFYMVGEGNKTFADCSDGFNLYSSPDLDSGRWTLEGQVLANAGVRAAAPPPFDDPVKYPYYRMERPKVFRCPTTANASAPWRLVFHCDTADVRARAARRAAARRAPPAWRRPPRAAPRPPSPPARLTPAAAARPRSLQ